jgi:serine/threonine-protein kinase HipA
MNACKISLKTVQKAAKRAEYRDADFRSLFGSIKVDPVIPFSRSEFLQDSVKYTKGMSISGVQQKLSLKIDDKYQLTPVIEGGEYILKPSPEEFPHAAENEHAAMVTSTAIGIETAQCGLVAFSDGQLAYITKRFDRIAGGGKLHQEDLVQGFGLASEGKYDKSYEAAGNLILQMTNGKMAVVLEFVKRVIHAYFIGNDDMHLKNISLQKDADTSSRYYDRLTPNYDSLFTEVFENMDNHGYLALDLLEDGFSEQYQHYGYYTGQDFVELGTRLDISKKLMRKTITQAISMKEELLNVIGRSYMPDEMKSKATDLIEQKSAALGTGVLDKEPPNTCNG